MQRVALLAIGILVACASNARAANSTVPGAITSYTTIECAGVEWRISGDDNKNCVVATEYRRQGDTTWKPAQPLWRVDTGLWIHGEDPGNLLAGSVFNLTGGTTYEVRLTLSDPDGGSSQQTVTVTTRTEPVAAPGARTRYVVPGSGGGTGTQTDPFKGLAAADAAAAAGDVFRVQPGTYTTKFTPTKSGTATQPIVYIGENAATVILDGNGGATNQSNCIDVSNRQYVFLENMTLRNCLRPVLAHSTVGVVVRRCTIQPVNQLLNTKGIFALTVRDLFVADNTILMPGQWEAIGRKGTYGTGGYGVEFTGNGVIVCYNKIFESWDGIDCGGGDGTAHETYNVDLYNNDIDRASDDATQTDAIHQNVRVFRNRLVNNGAATSGQPIFGGPLYVLYNEFYNTRYSTFKMSSETTYFPEPQVTSGLIAYHNTSYSSKSGWWESGSWHHIKYRNNILLGARVAYSLYIASGDRGDLDYTAYLRQQTTLVKYNTVAFSSLPSFYSGTGNEQRGLEVALGEFVRTSPPPHPEWDASQGYGTPVNATDYDVQLNASSLSVDRGQVLANINDGYTGNAPDLGCYERGKPLPTYGPRPPGGTADSTPPATIQDLR